MMLSLACLAMLGAADMLSVYVRQSLIQLYTPDAMRGRVGAVSSLFISASNELGEAESGFLAAIAVIGARSTISRAKARRGRRGARLRSQPSGRDRRAAPRHRSHPVQRLRREEAGGRAPECGRGRFGPRSPPWWAPSGESSTDTETRRRPCASHRCAKSGNGPPRRSEGPEAARSPTRRQGRAPRRPRRTAGRGDRRPRRSRPIADDSWSRPSGRRRSPRRPRRPRRWPAPCRPVRPAR
jgi:hypothetical protein